MRRMREQLWYPVLFAVPILVGAFSVFHYVKKARHKDIKAMPSVAVMKTPKKAERVIASAERSAAHHEESSVSVPVIEASKDGCTSVEYLGDGPLATRITKGEWSKVMDQFHQSKDYLTAWLNRNRARMPASTAALMESQIKNLKIQRPPTLEEPDLAWRGIGVWTQNGGDSPVIRVGGGFVKMALRQPKRAQFELTRLVAQSWTPCELKRVGAQSEPWQALLKCLDVTEESGCAPGTYSEGGWAVSSTLAAHLSPPGCTLPVFKDGASSQCLDKIPMGDANWKEARR